MAGAWKRNYGPALYWLKEATEQGNARAHTNLGILYMNGQGMTQNYAEARTKRQDKNG